jgi:cytochrome P450
MSTTTTSQEVPPESVEVPDHVPAELVVRLDHHNDAAAKADPVGFMDEIREQHRVVYSPVYEGFWAVTRYEDQRAVFQQHELFSSAPVGIPGGPGYGGHKLLPIELDPPVHTKYRGLINPVFAPKRIRAMEENSRAVANELIDTILASGKTEIDFITDYAEQFPTRIFVGLMGLPYERYKEFLQWNNALLHSGQIGDGLTAKREAGQQINEYLIGLIQERAKDPGDDIVSILLASEVDGEKLDHDEVLRAVFLLFMAGLDTVTAAHGWIFSWLARNPEHRARLTADESVIPGAIEELIRVHSFVNDARTVREDTEFAGVQMRKGDRVMLHGGAANRDPREFPNPLEVDFDRSPNRHIAFAAGPHRCVGSHLARLELRISMEEWHRRIPDYTITDEAAIRMHCGGVAGLDSLPLTISPRAAG